MNNEDDLMAYIEAEKVDKGTNNVPVHGRRRTIIEVCKALQIWLKTIFCLDCGT